MTAIAKTAIVLGCDSTPLDAALAKAGASIKSMMTKAAAALGAGLSIKWGIDLLDASENAQITMESILGSADLAKAGLKGLRDVFGDEAKHFQSGMKKLALAGVDVGSIPPILRTLGDAASALTPENLGGGIDAITDQMVTMLETAKVTEKQLKALGGMGINAPEILRKANGFGSIDELREALDKGQISSANAVRQLLQGMDAKFAGTFEKQQTTRIKEIIEDIGDMSAQSMKSFMQGAVNGDVKNFIRSIAADMTALKEAGEYAGRAVGDSFTIVANVFEGVSASAGVFKDLLTEAFGGGPKLEIGKFLEETSHLKLDLDAVKNGALDFAEAASVGFAWVGDKVSQYLVDPIQAFVGVLLKGVSAILKGFAEIMSMGSDLASGKFWDDVKTGFGVITDKLGISHDAAHSGYVDSVKAATARGPQGEGLSKTIEDAAKAVNALGDKAIANAIRDFKSGDIMANLAREKFAGFRAKREDQKNGVGVDWIEAGIGSALAGIDAIAPTQLGKAAYQKSHDSLKFSDTAEAVKAMLPTYSPNSAIQAGSQEAQRTVMENRQGSRGIDETLKQSLDVQKDTKVAIVDMQQHIADSQVVLVGI